MPLGHNAQYELILSNYLNKDNYTNYVLIDKYGSHIVPRLDRIKKDNLVKDFEMHSNVKFDTVIEVVEHYRNISYSREDYAVFSTINNMQLYNMIFKFGSSERDIIILDKDVLYIEGNNGSDLYIIDDNIYDSAYTVHINNKAKDLLLDILKLPVNNVFNIFIDNIHYNNNYYNNNLHNLNLLYKKDEDRDDYFVLNHKVMIENYWQGEIYRHIAIMDKNNNSYIALKQNDVMTLLPFYHTSLEKNIFILSPNSKGVVIDIDVNNIMLNKQGNNLLLTEKEAGSFNRLNIILRDYYKNQKQWLDTKLYSYSNGGISNIIDLNNIQRSAISYQEQYDNVIKEYVVDLTNGASYFITYNHHNSLRNYYNVDSQDERVGVIIFKNTPLKRLIVTDHQDHIFQDKLYLNHTLIINHWQKSKYHISMFEFHNGLNQERILVLNTTISRIILNNALDRHLNNIDIKVVKAVIDFLKLSYAKYNKQCNVSQELRYNFLEEELSYRIGDSYNQNYSSEEIRKYLSSSNDTTENRYIVGKVFMLLALKSYNELLIKYPYISNKDLHKIGDSYFYTVLPNSEVMIKTLNDNTHATIASTTKHTNDLDNIYQYIINNKQEIQQIITKLADLDNHHKHRHHHGEDNRDGYHSDNKTILSHHRVHRDIEDVQQIEKDDHNYIPNSDVEVMSISSSGSSAKPIGYSMVNWIRDNVSKYLFNHVKKEIVSNIDDNVIKKEILDIDCIR